MRWIYILPRDRILQITCYKIFSTYSFHKLKGVQVLVISIAQIGQQAKKYWKIIIRTLSFLHLSFFFSFLTEKCSLLDNLHNLHNTNRMLFIFSLLVFLEEIKEGFTNGLLLLNQIYAGRMIKCIDPFQLYSAKITWI